MRNPEQIRLVALRAADGGARLILRLECTGEDGTEREDLIVFSSRLDRVPPLGAVSPETYEYFCREADLCEAVGIGMRSLGAGAESRAKLLQKLRVRGVAPDIAREAAEELARRGFLDEIGGAVREAERGINKYWGDRRILADLKAKGYPTAACRAAQKRLAGEDSVARLLALLRRRHIPRPRDERETAKLFASLCRYGYSTEEIRRAMETWEK